MCHDDGSSKLNEQIERKAKNDIQNNLKASSTVATSTPITISHVKESFKSHANQFILECQSHSSKYISSSSIKWYKNGILIDTLSNGRYTTANQSGLLRLSISNPNETDSGEYRCEIELSGHPTQSAAHTVTIEPSIATPVSEERQKGRYHQSQKEGKEQQKPTERAAPIALASFMKNLTIEEGSRAKFVCSIVGNAEFSVEWFKDNIPLEPDRRYRTTASDAIVGLEISDVAPSDSGFYTCTIKGQRNSVTSSSKLTVYEACSSKSRKKSLTHDRPLPLSEFNKKDLSTYSDSPNYLDGRKYVDHSFERLVRNSRAKSPFHREITSSYCPTMHTYRHKSREHLPNKDTSYSNRIRESSHLPQLSYRSKSYHGDLSRISQPRATSSYFDGRHQDEIYRSHRSLSRSASNLNISNSYSNLRNSLPRLNSSCANAYSRHHNHHNHHITDTPKSSVQMTGRSRFHSRNAYKAHRSRSAHRDYSPVPRTVRSSTPGGYRTNSIMSDYPSYDSLRMSSRISRSFSDIRTIRSCIDRDLLHLPNREKYHSSRQIDRHNDYELATHILNPDMYLRWLKTKWDIEESMLRQHTSTRAHTNDDHMYTSKNRSYGTSYPSRTRCLSYDSLRRWAKDGDYITNEKTHGYFHRDLNKPQFQNQLGNHLVTAGGTIALQFEITNEPSEVHWFFEQNPIVLNDKARSLCDHGVYTLVISEAAQEHSGAYTCQAINAFGKTEAHANVHIVGPVVNGGKCPLFLSRPDAEIKIKTGDPFSFSFRLAGDPKPKLILLKGMRDITHNDRFLKEAHDDFIRFSVQKSRPTDGRTYAIVARNQHGTDFAFVTIKVKERARSITPPRSSWLYVGQEYSNNSAYLKNPPAPISSEPIVIDNGKSHLSLSWGKPLSTGAAPVIAYRVEAWLIGAEGGAQWKELGITPINCFDVFNLKAGAQYHFRVTARNRYGWSHSVQTTNPVTVGEFATLPEFTKILPGQIKVLIGKDFLLECIFRGNPKPSIQWYKDEIPLEQSDERISMKIIGVSTCRLEIKNVQAGDSGRITCEATNSQGRASTFARLQAITDYKIYEVDNKLKRRVNSGSDITEDTLPQFTMRLRDRRIQTSYPVRLTCQAIGFPLPEIAWFKDSGIITQNDRYVILNDGAFSTLEIMRATLDDSGTYTATAKNEHGSISCHCSLSVDKGIRAYIAPEFLCNLEPECTVKGGQEIRLCAQIEAYPTVGVNWYRNGVRIRPSRRIIPTLDDDGFVELVRPFTNQDAGDYRCVATNAVGNAESTCTVTIESCDSDGIIIPGICEPNMPYSKEPQFVKKPRSFEAYEGDTVIIDCEVIGDPKPEMRFLRDFLKPEYYKDALHFRRIGDGPEYRLEIPRAKLDYTGTYTAIASNCHGETRAIISLQISAKDISNAMDKTKHITHGNIETLPIFKRQLKDVQCCDGDSVRLECTVEAVPEPTITWEKDGKKLSQTSEDFSLSYDGERCVLTIKRVYPEDEGEYRCIASNNIGKTVSSACIIVDVAEEKENLLSCQLIKPSGLLSANSTPNSTPRATPTRSMSPTSTPMSYRSAGIDVPQQRHIKFMSPRFFAVPHNRVAEAGETVQFQCAIAGHPMPWSTWDKDGCIVTPTARITIKERDDLRILEIEEVTHEDAGLYRITLENRYGRIEATARLDIIGYGRSAAGRGLRISPSPRRNISVSRRLMGSSTQIGGRPMLGTNFGHNFRGTSAPVRRK